MCSEFRFYKKYLFRQSQKKKKKKKNPNYCFLQIARSPKKISGTTERINGAWGPLSTVKRKSSTDNKK